MYVEDKIGRSTYISWQDRGRVVWHVVWCVAVGRN